MSAAPHPDRQRRLRRDVERIAEHISRKRRLDVFDVLGSKRGSGLAAARIATMRMVVDETGCTAAELAWAWGCSFGLVKRALEVADARPKTKPTYDAATVRRLQWQHGEQRASVIVSGVDLSTNKDIAAWRRFGSKSA